MAIQRVRENEDVDIATEKASFFLAFLGPTLHASGPGHVVWGLAVDKHTVDTSASEGTYNKRKNRGE